MSYASTSSQATITVANASMTLTVTPSPPWVPGQTLTFIVGLSTPVWTTDSVVIYVNGSGVAQIQLLPGQHSGNTTWTVPQSYAGQQISIYAQDSLFGVTSNTVTGTVLYPTQISISAPSTVYVNQSFTVSGTLQYQNASGSWVALGNQTVSIKGSWGASTTATTNSNGQYSAQITAPSSPGTYTITATFAPTGTLFAPATAQLAMGTSTATPTVSTTPSAQPGMLQFIGGMLAIVGLATGSYLVAKRKGALGLATFAGLVGGGLAIAKYAEGK